MPLPRDISGKSLKTGLVDTGLYQTGDYVVPGYNESGRKIEAGQIQGDSADVQAMADKMAAHTQLFGGEPLPSAPALRKAGRPKAAQLPTPAIKTVQKGKSAPVHQAQAVIKADGFQPPKQASADIDPILQPYPPIKTSSPIEVVFSTQLGRIKVDAEAVLDSTNALVLVFAHEGEIRYEPAPGANVQLIINGRVESTMYPGFKFPWTDGQKRLMVFVKIDEE